MSSRLRTAAARPIRAEGSADNPPCCHGPEIICAKKDKPLVKYESLNGKLRHTRLRNGGNGVGTVTPWKKKKKERILIDCRRAERIGCKHGDDQASKG